MKSYKEKELKYYVIFCIFVYLRIHFDENTTISNFWTLFEPLLTSPIFYIFAILLDSLYSSYAKFQIIYFGQGMPSRKIFDKIQNGKLPWFTSEKVKSAYKDLYSSMPSGPERYEHQASQWYEIYIKYRDNGIESLDISATEYRILRDINIATVNLCIVYLVYSLICGKFYWAYIIFLIVAFLLTNLAARIKGYRWVFNVIAYDINHKS